MPTKKPAPKTATKTTAKSAAKPKTRAAKKHVAATSRTHQSFRVSKPANNFFSFKITNQSAYWAILMLLVLLLGAWTIRQEVEIQRIYDSIETNAASIDELDQKSVEILKNKKQAEQNQ